MARREPRRDRTRGAEAEVHVRVVLHLPAARMGRAPVGGRHEASAAHGALVGLRRVRIQDQLAVACAVHAPVWPSALEAPLIHVPVDIEEAEGVASVTTNDRSRYRAVVPILVLRGLETLNLRHRTVP